MHKIDIGLEIHMRLNTKTKLWSGSSNSFTLQPNVNISPIELGISGASPMLNKAAVEKAIRLALITNCSIAHESQFDRKQYTYPDLPCGYQITQFYQPYATNGKVIIDNNTIIINQIHMESDAGKIVNENGKVLLDYNRAGCPLVEIVTGVCFSNSTEVISFLKYLIAEARYLNISNANLEDGDFRVDVNVSCRKSNGSYGMRGEIKNLNSLASIKNAIEYIERTGFTNTLSCPATLQYDVEKDILIKLRDKEMASDYGYIADGCLPTLQITKEMIEKQQNLITFDRNDTHLNSEHTRSVREIMNILQDKGVNIEVINTIINNYDLYKLLTKFTNQSTYIINICAGILAGHMNEIANNEHMIIDKIQQIVSYIPHKISINNANNVIKLFMKDIHMNIENIIKQYLINDDVNEIKTIIQQVINENTLDWNNYIKTKETKLQNVLIGKIRKKNANVSIDIVMKLLQEMQT